MKVSPELVKLHEEVAVEVVEVVDVGDAVDVGVGGRVEEVALGQALHQQPVGQVGQVDAHDGEGVPVAGVQQVNYGCKGILNSLYNVHNVYGTKYDCVDF